MSCALVAVSVAGSALAQDDTVRIETSLVQSPFTVVDKQGRFVEGLRSEHFELRLNGKPRQIEFFETVAAGTEDETRILARQGRNEGPAGKDGVPAATGRKVIFFIDDIHLSFDSLGRVRRQLLSFIDTIGLDDRVLIASASGRIGFLQQLSGNKDALRAAVGRINHIPTEAGGREFPPMTEYEAHSIEAGDQKTLDHFIALFLENNGQIRRSLGATSRTIAERSVRSRARRILQQTEFATKSTLTALRSIVRSSGELAGRKVMFFVSDGFLANTINQNTRTELSEIIGEGLRSNVVVYSLQSSGLGVAGPDASSQVVMDADGEVSTSFLGEDIARQETLDAIAVGTGGKSFFNTNSLDDGVRAALRDTSRYYLVGWYPEGPAEIRDRVTLDLRVKGRSELRVIGPTAAAPSAASRRTPAAAGSAGDALKTALGALNADTSQVPLSLSLTYLQTANRGAVVTILTQVGDDTTHSPIDLAGLVLSDDGKLVTSFGDRMLVDKSSLPAGERRPPIIQATQTTLQPGLYQVRVAARRETGAVGATSDWILVPDTRTANFILGSLFVGEVERRSLTQPAPVARVSVDHRFARSSHLRFSTYIYNASVAGGPADVTIDARVLAGSQTIMSIPQQRVDAASADPARLQYAGELSLSRLDPGRYVLEITATDQRKRARSTQNIVFWVI